MVAVQALAEKTLDVPVGETTILDELRPGDYIKIVWDKKDNKDKQAFGYGHEGIVVQVTRKYVAVKSPAGYNFCVGLYHIMTGVKVQKTGQ